MRGKNSCLLFLLCLGCACSPSTGDVLEVDVLPEVYPDYVDVTVPAEIAPLNFAMVDDSITSMDVVIAGEKSGTLHASGAFADFDMEEWHRLLETNRGADLNVSVLAKKNGAWMKYRPFTIHVSRYPLEEWGITYRRVVPGYKIYGHMGIYQRNLGSFEETALLDNKDIAGECVNCHVANRGNPSRRLFHVRGEHGATVVCRDSSVELLASVNDSLGGAMVYPYWHPDGRYCAFSTNKTAQLFHSSNNKRIEVFDSKSDVFVYDTEAHVLIRDSLLEKPELAENCPAFSPDGKWLYFTAAERQVYPRDYQKEKYSLYRIRFDGAKKAFGEQAYKLVSADSLDKSVTWPRPSFDGRYVMYTQCDYGYFSVWHPESDLWLLELKTGKTRRLDEVNSDRAESFHNWSGNSRWFLFTSRREDGLYTRIYFSSLDEQGKATKPFLMPQHDPKRYYRRLMYSYNTPDFILRPIDTDVSKLRERLWSGHRINM